jgi:nitrogen fixation NifU-like protein
MDLKALYRDVILDHYKKPRNSQELSAPTHESKCKNPSCGDRVTLELKIEDDRIADIGFVGTGCAISQASTSMMTEGLKGKTVAEARALYEAFHQMIVEGDENPNATTLGDLIALQGVAKLHARTKCAMCGWSAFEAAIDNRDEEVDLDETELE